MVHQAEMIVGIRFPRPIDFDRACGLTAGSVAQVGVMQRYCPLNSSIALKGELPVKKPIVEFKPPPGRSNSGKPDPASS
jgi:hypothetical protein